MKYPKLSTKQLVREIEFLSGQIERDVLSPVMRNAYQVRIRLCQEALATR